jgi:hypothetical protein
MASTCTARVNYGSASFDSRVMLLHYRQHATLVLSHEECFQKFGHLQLTLHNAGLKT